MATFLAQQQIVSKKNTKKRHLKGSKPPSRLSAILKCFNLYAVAQWGLTHRAGAPVLSLLNQPFYFIFVFSHGTLSGVKKFASPKSKGGFVFHPICLHIFCVKVVRASFPKNYLSRSRILRSGEASEQNKFPFITANMLFTFCKYTR